MHKTVKDKLHQTSPDPGVELIRTRRAIRMHPNSRRTTLGLIIATAFTRKATAMDKRMSEIMRIESIFPFADTVDRLRSHLEGKGFTIFAAIDQREAAKSVGLDMPPTTLLIYGNPRGGTPLMIAAPDFGIELPLKLLVREETGGRVFVVYTPAQALEGRHGLPTGLAARLAGAEPLIAAAVGGTPR